MKICFHCKGTKNLRHHHIDCNKDLIIRQVFVCKKCGYDILKKSLIKYPQKTKARSLFSMAIAKGIIKRAKKCSLCNAKGRIEGHHDDYSKPLKVR